MCAFQAIVFKSRLPADHRIFLSIDIDIRREIAKTSVDGNFKKLFTLLTIFPGLLKPLVSVTFDVDR